MLGRSSGGLKDHTASNSSVAAKCPLRSLFEERKTQRPRWDLNPHLPLPQDTCSRKWRPKKIAVLCVIFSGRARRQGLKRARCSSAPWLMRQELPQRLSAMVRSPLSTQQKFPTHYLQMHCRSNSKRRQAACQFRFDGALRDNVGQSLKQERVPSMV